MKGKKENIRQPLPTARGRRWYKLQEQEASKRTKEASSESKTVAKILEEASKLQEQAREDREQKSNVGHQQRLAEGMIRPSVALCFAVGLPRLLK